MKQNHEKKILIFGNMELKDKTAEVARLLKQNGYTFNNKDTFVDCVIEYINDTQDALTQKNAFIELFKKDPRAARVLVNWKDGAEPITELIAVIGADNLKNYLDTNGEDDAFKTAQAEYLQNLKNAEEFEEVFNNNLNKSLAELSKNELPTETLDKTLDFMNGIANEVKSGVYNAEKIAKIATLFTEPIPQSDNVDIKHLVEYIKQQEKDEACESKAKTEYINRLKIAAFDYIKDTML